MTIEAEKIKGGIVEVRNLKRKMEKDIARILEDFELETGLKPGRIHHEKVSTIHRFDYTVHISVKI